MKKNPLNNKAMQAVAPIEEPTAMPVWVPALRLPGFDGLVGVAVTSRGKVGLVFGATLRLGAVVVGAVVEEMLDVEVVELAELEVEVFEKAHVFANAFGSWAWSSKYWLPFPSIL